MRVRIPWSLRIALLTCVPALVAVCAMTWFSLAPAKRAAESKVRDLTLAELQWAAGRFADAGESARPARLRELGQRLNGILAHIDSRGTVLDSTAAMNPIGVAHQEIAVARRVGAGLRDPDSDDPTLTYASVRLPDGDAVLWMSRNDARRLKSVQPSTAWSWALTILACVLVVALVASMTRRVRAPVADLTRVAHDLTRGDLDARAKSARDSDLNRLGRALNRMSRRLQSTLNSAEQEAVRLTTVLDGLTEGVIALDDEEHISFVNDAARDMFGIARGERVSGVPLYQHIRDPRILGLAQAVTSGGNASEAEIHQEGPPHRTIQVYAAPVSTASPGIVMVLRDLSKLRRLESMRSDFVSNVSHELRTPLAAIAAAVETLRDDETRLDPDSGPRFISMIERNAARLEALLQDILALSRMESRPETLAREPLEFGAVVRNATEDLRPRAEKAGIELVSSGDGKLSLRGDATMLYRVVENLVVNAINYTPEGGRVSVETAVDQSQAVLCVQDTGIGIPESSLDRLFERFYRVDKARSRGAGGTGLGLAIVKHATALHGGTLEVESRVGEGSKFTVRIPLSAGTSQVIQ